jgi:type IV secretory pathway VirB10-like protein
MTNEQNQVPVVTDKRIAPPGILPRNIQTVFLGGVAVVMVIVIVFSSRSGPKPRNSPPPAAETTINPPDEDKVKDYRKRIEDDVRKLAKEQAELARTKTEFAGATNQPMLSPGSGGPGMSSYAPPSATLQSEQGTSQESWVREEKEKREYLSRFASNFALTFRSDPKPANSVDASAPLPQALPPIDPRLYAALMLPTGSQPSQAVTENQAQNTKPAEENAQTPKPSLPDLNRSTGKDYRLFEGTIIETVLTNRLDGTFSGPVNCMVSYDVYSHDHNHILIPSGSRVLGDVHPVENSGQQRLAVTFHRLVMPDGFSLNLDQFHGLDQVGETGLRDQVNHHYLQIFGASIAIGMIAGLAQNNTQYGIATSATDAYRQGVATSLSQSSMHVLDRFLNILPTFTIREGQRIKVYLAQDLTVPAYENHEMPDDL